MEARIAKVESDVHHIEADIGEIRKDIREMRSDAKEDFRILFASLIGVALGLGTLLAKGFHWL